MTHKPEINVWFRVAGRDRDEGDKNTWQADCWHEGRDYHGIGSSPEEAVFRMSRFWVVERGFLREMASEEPQGPHDLSIGGEP